EWGVLLWRSRRMELAARGTLRLKACARAFPASAYAVRLRCRERDRRVEARNPAGPGPRRRARIRGSTGPARVALRPWLSGRNRARPLRRMAGATGDPIADWLHRDSFALTSQGVFVVQSR